MTEQEIGELWRRPENYMRPLSFGAALIAAGRETCLELVDGGMHPASVVALDGTSMARTAWQDGWNAAVEEIASRMERHNVRAKRADTTPAMPE